ncbi:MAG: class I SAM-dependent methyltransferase [Candidatus Moranbacteria bacterium]|nr:class I SAM-dependent methyltransferase [Candidatus Moranbacteria bacterium]
MNIEKYSEVAPQYYQEEVPQLLDKYLLSTKFSNILDCGCGDGPLLYALCRREDFGTKKIFAIDLSQKRIELVKKISTNIIATVDSAEEMDTIADQSIDFFISTQVIEHVDDKKMIMKIAEKVKSGGTIYVSTVFKKWYGWYFYRNHGTWVLDPTHLREYSSDEQLLDLFDKREFVLLENRKQLQWFPVSDFFIKRLGLKDRKLYENRLMQIIRKVKIPILGYYNWEIVMRRV